MTRQISIFPITVAAIISVISTTGLAIAGSAFDSSKEVAMPRANLKYNHINPAIEMADAYGDMSKGMHGTFGKFPANFDAGFHTHTGAYHGVVIKGVMTNPFKDEANPPRMEAGSYWYVPAGSVHATACISDVPCEFYYYADEKFDFFPVK
jgi:hypothetical protein